MSSAMLRIAGRRASLTAFPTKTLGTRKHFTVAGLAMVTFSGFVDNGTVTILSLQLPANVGWTDERKSNILKL